MSRQSQFIKVKGDTILADIKYPSVIPLDMVITSEITPSNTTDTSVYPVSVTKVGDDAFTMLCQTDEMNIGVYRWKTIFTQGEIVFSKTIYFQLIEE